MKIVTKILFKGKQHNPSRVWEPEEGKEVKVAENWELIFDNITNGYISQQRIKTEDKAVADKLSEIKPYTEIVIMGDISFYQGKPKIKLLDIIDNETEVKSIESIIERYN